MAGYYDRDRNVRKADGTYNTVSDQTMAGTMNHPYTHHGNVAEYQASGIPFVMQVSLTTGQMKKVDFPFVTQWIMIQSSNDVYVAFSAAGQQGGSGGDNFFIAQTLSGESPGSMPIMRLKCKEIYFKDPTGGTTVTVIAGLTNVPAADFPDITGLVGIGADATVATYTQ